MPAIINKDSWKEVLRISWPLIVANSFWNLQLTIDRIFLGNFSTDALGAAIAVMGVFWTPMALVQQTAAYAVTFVAQYFGANQFRKIGPSIWQAVYLSIIGSLLMLLLIPLSPSLFAFMGHSAKLQVMEVAYFDALCYSALPAALVAALSSFFTGRGESKIIMWINCVGLVANVIFDYVLIFGNWGFPALGIAGAGYATALANWCSAAYAFYLIMHKKFESEFATRSGWRWDTDLMKRFVRYGIPSGMQWALEGLAFTVFLIFVGRMPNGDAALAASGIVVTVMMLSVLPPLGIAQGVSVLVGQYLGENRPERAESSSWAGVQIALCYIVTIGLTMVVFPNFYIQWFHNETDQVLWAEVKKITPYLLMFVAFFTCFDSMNFIFSFALKGAGDTRFVTAIALTVPWPLMVLPTWLVMNMPNAIYLAWGAASLYVVVQAMIFLRRFTGGKWKSMRVIAI